MAAVVMENWHQPNHFTTTCPRFQYAHPQPPIATPDIPIPPRNEKELSRDFLITILNHFATLIPSHFNGLPLRLVVHGGACMLLHPGLSSVAKEQHYLATNSPSDSPHNKLPRRVSTRDVDYIHRSFVTEWQAVGVMDATERIKSCIKLTAQHFQLGADWMNADADVALPMFADANAKQYDPIYHGALQPNNVHLHTVFKSANGLLTLISVPPVWSIVLKLVRYTRYDAGDICLLLRNGTNLNNVQWTASHLETWLRTDAAPMNYHLWTEAKLQELKGRIQHAIHTVNSWDAETARGPVIPDPIGDGDDARDDWPRGVTHRSRPDVHPQHPPHPHGRWSVPPPSIPRPATRGMSTQDAALDLEDRWLTSQRSHQHQHQHQHQHHRPTPNHTPWHPRFDAEVQKFDHDLAAMLQQSMSMTVLVGGLPGIAEKSARRTRDKHRAKSCTKNRRSKWAVFLGRPGDSDSDTDEEEGTDERRRGRFEAPVSPQSWHQQQQHQQREDGQPFFPRPSAWLIYAPPGGPGTGTPSQHAASPYHVGQARPPTTTPYTFDQRPSSTSIPYPPDQRRSSTSTPYLADQRPSATSTSYPSEIRRSITSPPYHPDQQHQLTMSTLYNRDPRQSRPTTPFIPPDPHQGSRSRSTTPFHPDPSQPQNPQSSTPYRTGQYSHSRSASPMPAPWMEKAKERHRPNPLELLPIGPLLVF